MRTDCEAASQSKCWKQWSVDGADSAVPLSDWRTEAHGAMRVSQSTAILDDMLLCSLT